MVTHYFTLLALAGELDSLIRGSMIEASFTQQKDELIISLEGAKNDAGIVQGHSIVISVEPKFNYCYLREHVARARKNSVDLFTQNVGKTIEEVGVLPFDRTLIVRLSGGSHLLLRLYGTATSNVLLVNRDMVIGGAFKNGKELAGTVIPEPGKRFDEAILRDTSSFTDALHSRSSGSTVAIALKKTIPMLGSTYVSELLYRARVEERKMINELTPDDLTHVYEITRSILDVKNHKEPSVYMHGGEPWFLSVIQLSHVIDAKQRSFERVNDAIGFFVGKTFSRRGTNADKDELLDSIRAELERSRRSLSAADQQATASKRAEEYERTGKLIMAHLHSLTRGMKEAELPDVFSDGSPVHVQLDPKLQPARNAEKYFEKAKKAKLAGAESATRLAGLIERVKLLEKLHSDLEPAETPEDIREFKKMFNDELLSMKLITTESGRSKEQPPFRIFTVAGGLEVWVGKSSANNDLLTTKYAKPNDLWFHARGASGSHTVLKVSGRSEAPPKEAIRQAASIAAYYSKMRKAANVPVAYCERKYVRKPRHVPEGTVHLEREEIIFVQPRLP